MRLTRVSAITSAPASASKRMHVRSPLMQAKCIGVPLSCWTNGTRHTAHVSGKPTIMQHMTSYQCLSVGIRTVVEQHPYCFVLTVRRSQVQRRVPFLRVTLKVRPARSGHATKLTHNINRLNIRPIVQQHAHDFHMAVASCPVKRRPH